ncbi:GGDEF domain-containing protein [Aeromicrobium sp. UC242_57]|uniref:GGDEF domain-containing protein n=1 Tax=Aeromicrobium sp. UC242_57 TaxID=3374624 RepID=UPI00379FA352
MTGVLSRRSIEQHLTRLAGRRPELCHVLVVDVDRFKGVNDSFGHLAGDQVLAAVATRLCGHDPRLTLGRWGGDEFVGVLRGLGADEVGLIADDLTAACASSPVAVADDTHVAISVSIGVAPCDGDDWHAWVAKADAAMYARKDRGSEDTTWYDRRR